MFLLTVHYELLLGSSHTLHLAYENSKKTSRLAETCRSTQIDFKIVFSVCQTDFCGVTSQVSAIDFTTFVSEVSRKFIGMLSETLQFHLSTNQSSDLVHVAQQIHFSLQTANGNVLYFAQLSSSQQKLKSKAKEQKLKSLYPIITEITHHPSITFKCLRGDLYPRVIYHWNHQLKPY